MAARHAMGLVPELVYREETLDLPHDVLDVQKGVNLPTSLHVQFVFDFQARPHVILAVKDLTGPALGLQRKPSYWDLPVELQSLLLEKQLAVSSELAGLRLEVHLGDWVSGRHIHAHVVLPLHPYYALRARVKQEAKWTAEDAKRRVHYVSKVHRDHARYRALDGPLTHQAATSGAPQRTADLTAFETVVFDADKSGTAAIDLVFRGAPTIQSMAHSELCVALSAIRELCEALAVDGAHLLLPAPAAPDPVPAPAGMLADRRHEDGAHQDRAVRLVIRADIFACCLPPDKRLGWYELWARGDPVARAYKEDMSLLAEGSACLSSAPVAAGTERGTSKFKPHKRVKPSKPCVYFRAPGGCRHGAQCNFIH